MKKLLIFFGICGCILFIACSEKEAINDEKIVATVDSPGKMIFTKNCRLCHGATGNLGVSGAANLKISALNIEEIKTVVSEGRKSMPSWKKQLTPEEIQQVAEYILTLRN